MEPRTKIQREVVSLSDKLPAVPQSKIRYGYAQLSKRYAKRRNTLICLECGHKWKDQNPPMAHRILKYDNCPCCKTKIQFSDFKGKRTHEWSLMTVFDTFKGFQVIRSVYIRKNYTVGEECTYFASEVAQIWVSLKGQIVALEKNKSGSYYASCYSFGSDLTVKSIPRDIDYGIVYPKKKLLPEIVRNGFKGKNYKIPVHKLFAGLLADHRVETLFKAEYPDVAEYFIDRRNDPKKKKFLNILWQAWKIADRYEYGSMDFSIWADHIETLHFLGKDTRNPKYICPDDLHKEHSRYTKKKRAVLGRLLYERHETEYAAEKAKFFGLEFTDGVVTVKVFDSVVQIDKESTWLNHCAFTNMYHLKKHSLLLSARLADTGKVVETVEVSLRTFSVEQSRGQQNKPSQYNDRIIDLVNANMHLIRKAHQKSQRKTTNPKTTQYAQA